MDARRTSLKGFEIANDRPFALIAGPDSIESEEHAVMMASELKHAAAEAGVPFVFKASYDKANRTSVDSWRGVGLQEGMRILARIREELGVPVTTDVHTVEEAKTVGGTVDMIQLPALLSRQTDLIVAAAKTGKVVNIKKGQFIAPHNIGKVIAKAVSTGNEKVVVTERGYMFGYNDVVADMRSLPVMARTGYPVCFDASHTVQTPSAAGGVSGGDRTLIPPLARAAAAAGVAALFMEVHDDPDSAKVDGASSLDLKDLPKLLSELVAIDSIVKRSHEEPVQRSEGKT